MENINAQPEAEIQAQPEAAGTEQQTQTEQKPKTYTIKHNKELMEIPADDEKVIPLLQKGLDYDGKIQRLRDIEGSKAFQFLESQAKKTGKSRDELAEIWEKELTQREINQFAEANDLSPEIAQRLLEAEQIKKRDQEEREDAERKLRDEQEKRERQSAELSVFTNDFPDVDVNNLPHEVLEEWIENNVPLKTAYKAYTADILKARIAEMENKDKVDKTNKENAETSMGSVSGEGERPFEVTAEWLKTASQAEYEKHRHEVWDKYKSGKLK